MTEIFFKSEGHKKRFVEAVQAQGKVYDQGKIDPEYGAAFYVLTSDLSTWEKARDYIDREGIDFEAMFQELDWSGGYYVLLQWAANLFNPQAAHIDPVELMRLDDNNFKVAHSALLVRRYELAMSAYL
jgi:hypothetical protein